MRIQFSIFVFSTGFFHSAIGEHVLFLQTCSSYSHRVAQWPLALGLSRNGHNIMFISPYNPTSTTNSPNITELQPQVLKTFMEDLFEGKYDATLTMNGLMPQFYFIFDYVCYQACEKLYRSEEFTNWLSSSPQLDLIISDVTPECSYGLARKLNAKNILFTPSSVIGKYFEPFGMISESSSVPTMERGIPLPFSFVNRVWGVLLPFLWRTLEYSYYEKYKSLFEMKLGVRDMPNVHDLSDLTSLIINNGDFLTDYPRSTSPFLVKVEGLHLKKPGQHNPLPNEIEAFINDGNSAGFIYISFGTVFKPGTEFKQAIFNAIKSFPNLRFLCRWEGRLPTNETGNLKFINWIDQQDLLEHEKLRIFITQAGRPSSQEALFSGVPMITFPFCADQEYNAHRLVELGSTIRLDISGLTETKLITAISEILNNPIYKENALRIANLAKDVPIPPEEKAVWWVEFVLRHTKEELGLLKPLSRHLPWYQKRDLDVWAFLGSLLAISSCIFYAFARRVSSRLSRCLWLCVAVITIKDSEREKKIS